MRRHKKKENMIPRTDKKQNSLNPLESYIIIPPAAVAYIQSNENPFPPVGQTSTEYIGRTLYIHSILFFLLSYSTYPAEQKHMIPTGKDL